MDQETFQAMQNLFAELDMRIRDIKNRTLSGIASGMIRSNDSSINARVESLTESHRQQLEQWRAEFLQTQKTDSVLQGVMDVLQEYGRQFELLDLQVDEAIIQRDLDELSRCAQEDPQFGAMIKPVLERFGR